MFKQLDPTDLDTVKYVAAIFDTCLYGGRRGNTGFIFTRSRDKDIADQLQQAAGGTVSRQGDGVYIWYGSIKDWPFYTEVLKHMHSMDRKQKLAEAVSGRLEKLEGKYANVSEKAQIAAAADSLNGLITKLKEAQSAPPPAPAITIDPEAPYGRYANGHPVLACDRRKKFKDLTEEERVAVRAELHSRPKIRLALEVIKIIQMLGHKDEHSPEELEQARERWWAIRNSMLNDGLEVCVAKHAPPE